MSKPVAVAVFSDCGVGQPDFVEIGVFASEDHAECYVSGMQRGASMYSGGVRCYLHNGDAWFGEQYDELSEEYDDEYQRRQQEMRDTLESMSEDVVSDIREFMKNTARETLGN